MTFGFYRRLALAVIVGLLVLSPLTPARADAVDDALALFASDAFNDTAQGIEAIGKSGAPNSAAIVTALAAGKLFFDPATKAVYYRDASGKLIDAKTAAEVPAEPAGLKAVRLNNRLRTLVAAAAGSLDILSEDPAKRRSAANAVFKSRDATALAAIDTALAKEQDSGVKAALEQARASIIVTFPGASDEDRITSIGLIADRGDGDAAALLRSLPADLPDSVKTAASDALSTVETKQAAWAAAQNIVYGISLGSVLLLAAVGLAITFGQMGVINMAHGEMVMIGAYVTFMVQDVIRTSAPGLFDYSLLIAIPLAFLVAAAVGIAIERSVIRFLYGRPLETLLATWGISLILIQAIRSLFGPTNREVGAPSWLSGSLDLGGLSLTYNRIAIVVFALLVFFALLLVLKKTALGLQVRAVTQNRRMAAAMGIRTDWIDAMTFGLGSGVAGMAGVALSQIDNVSPNLGQGYIIDSFMVVVFGGVGNLWGTLVGAMTLGIANKFLEPYAGAVLGKIILLIAIILFIQKRPRGLFALKGRAVEA
jgi:urea transport system permease protein